MGAMISAVFDTFVEDTMFLAFRIGPAHFVTSLHQSAANHNHARIRNDKRSVSQGRSRCSALGSNARRHVNDSPRELAAKRQRDNET
jgi:hypothetical protein